MMKPSKDSYSKKEAQQRFEAAIRGAKIVGHKPMNDIPKKDGKSRAPGMLKMQQKKAGKK